MLRCAQRILQQLRGVAALMYGSTVSTPQYTSTCMPGSTTCTTHTLYAPVLYYFTELPGYVMSRHRCRHQLQVVDLATGTVVRTLPGVSHH